MMLPAHREAELEGIIELAKPAAYIVVEKYLGFSYVPMANAMKEKYSCIRHIFVDSESGDISGMIAETYGENRAFPAEDGYETAVLLLSGGTTGVPKLIPRTHTDYMYNARMSAKRCRLDSSDVYLASLPVAHNFPLCCPGLLGTLDVGGKVVLASATSPDDILDAITEEGVTITALVPAMVTVCMEMLEWDEDFDISKLRYNKIIIMTDADVDGAHIATLMLTFLYRFMPELIKQGHVYLATPPLYKIEKNKNVWYAYSDEELNNILVEIGRDQNNKIQRYKGLGEMDAEQLWETTMDPEHRILKQVMMDDESSSEIDVTFTTLMGDKVEPRREFIEENAKYVQNLDI